MEATPNTQPWRELFPVHPCADVFPMLSYDEIDELAKDIRANGLRECIVLWRDDDDAVGDARIFVLDGRNRLAALHRLGVTFDRVGNKASFPDGHSFQPFRFYRASDLAAFVISANLRRRHLKLTKEAQAELIVKAVEAGSVTTDRATVARSVSRAANGRVQGSTKDPVLAKAVDEAKKHGISKRTVQNARAKVNGTRQVPSRPPVTRVTKSTAPREGDGSFTAALKELRREITRRRKANHDERKKHRWNPDAIMKREQTDLLDWIETRLDAITEEGGA